MPATVTTREQLEAGISDEAVAGLIQLRLMAGAIRCWREGNVLLTEWNVFGQNDDPAPAN
jgi:hypothetical protein